MNSVTQPSGQEADEAAVRGLLQQLNAAWGDADAYAA
jgi:hypothetical protein